MSRLFSADYTDLSRPFSADYTDLSRLFSADYIRDLQDFRDSIMNNPYQGTEMSPGIRKIRLTIDSKGRGKYDLPDRSATEETLATSKNKLIAIG